MSRRPGLPKTHRMRADAHFVDELTTTAPSPVGRMIDIDRVHPNPGQPRRDFEGIDQLAESIREKGILEPILVRPQDEPGHFQIIAGERRYQAARKVGLSKVPCIELDVDDQGSLEISLIENLQRRDLTHFEEAEAIAKLVDDFSYTHEQVARKLGRSRTSITELLSLNRMPGSVKEACRRADIRTKSTLMEIVRQPSEREMLALIRTITSGGLTRDEVRELKRGQEDRPEEPSGVKPYVFRYRPPDRDFSLSLRFTKETVEPKELLSALEEIVQELRSQIKGR